MMRRSLVNGDIFEYANFTCIVSFPNIDTLEQTKEKRSLALEQCFTLLHGGGNVMEWLGRLMQT